MFYCSGFCFSRLAGAFFSWSHFLSNRIFQINVYQCHLTRTYLFTTYTENYKQQALYTALQQSPFSSSVRGMHPQNICKDSLSKLTRLWTNLSHFEHSSPFYLRSSRFFLKRICPVFYHYQSDFTQKNPEKANAQIPGKLWFGTNLGQFRPCLAHFGLNEIFLQKRVLSLFIINDYSLTSCWKSEKHWRVNS